MTPQEIKELRRQHNLTQQAFADRIGIKVDTVRSWESGRKTPSGPSLRVIELLKEGKL